jgi:sterol desaturase/sphingolipid hydroxylase (fatty acid hydroxylase superfamily)
MANYNWTNVFTDYVDPGPFAPVFYLVLMSIELFINSKEKLELYERKDTIANLKNIIGVIFTSFVSRILLYYVFTVLYQYRVFNIPNIWWAWVLLVFADDITYYWYHRIHHEVRIFWAAHIVHHSSQKLNLTTPFREPWTVGFYYNIFWLWLPLLGFQPWMVFSMLAISLLYQYWIHCTVIGKLGVLELFMNTPSHHRVHHASNIQYLDKNHGGFFIIWDKLFGTFKDEIEKPVYGLTKNINTYNPIKINFQEYASLWNDIKKEKLFTNKMKYLFYPPGWNPDGSGTTTKQLQKEIL